MSEENNDKYVTHGFLKDKEYQIYRYIDVGDQQIRDLYFKLDKKIDLEGQRTQQMIEQQRKMVNGIEELNKNYLISDQRYKNLEKETKHNAKKIQEVSQTYENKMKNNTDVLVAIISTIGVIGAAAFGFAQVFF